MLPILECVIERSQCAPSGPFVRAKTFVMPSIDMSEEVDGKGGGPT